MSNSNDPTVSARDNIAVPLALKTNIEVEDNGGEVRCSVLLVVLLS
jgi:hypothetical protein